MYYDSFEAADQAIESMNGQYLMNKAISVQFAFKKDGKGERHGSQAERLLAAQARKNNGLSLSLRDGSLRDSKLTLCCVVQRYRRTLKEWSLPLHLLRLSCRRQASQHLQECPACQCTLPACQHQVLQCVSTLT